MVVIIVGVIENDKVGMVKKYRDNLMYKSVKSSAITHLLCYVCITEFFIYIIHLTLIVFLKWGKYHLSQVLN